MYLFHVQALDRFEDLLQRWSRKGAGLVEDEHTLAEGHQRRNALDAKLSGELLVRVRVQLREHDALVLLRRLLIDRAEPLTRAAPLRPEIHQHDVVISDRALEVFGVMLRVSIRLALLLFLLDNSTRAPAAP